MEPVFKPGVPYHMTVTSVDFIDGENYWHIWVDKISPPIIADSECEVISISEHAKAVYNGLLAARPDGYPHDPIEQRFNWLVGARLEVVFTDYGKDTYPIADAMMVIPEGEQQSSAVANHFKGDPRVASLMEDAKWENHPSPDVPYIARPLHLKDFSLKESEWYGPDFAYAIHIEIISPTVPGDYEHWIAIPKSLNLSVDDVIDLALSTEVRVILGDFVHEDTWTRVVKSIEEII